MSKPETIKINDVKYVRKGTQKEPEYQGDINPILLDTTRKGLTSRRFKNVEITIVEVK